MDVENTCYTCLRKDNNHLITLLEVDNDNMSYLDKLSTCISSKLNYEKYMKVCRVCLTQLREAFEFITMVKITQESTHLWQNTLQEPKFNLEDYEYKLEDTGETENIYGRNTVNDDEEITSKKHVCKAKQKLKSGEETKEKMYNCESCNQRFDKRWKAQRHCKRMHLAEKQYICSYCNKAFKQRHHLREHLTIHTGAKCYTCNICEKSFPRSSSLGRHLRSHEKPHGQKTKRKPFLCPICGKKFDFENGGERHMRIHLGIKKYECNICNRRFTQSTHLSVHMRTHTGEKPFICDTCGEAFALNAGLQKHMRSHKNDGNNSGLKIEILENIVLKT